MIKQNKFYWLFIILVVIAMAVFQSGANIVPQEWLDYLPFGNLPDTDPVCPEGYHYNGVYCVPDETPPDDPPLSDDLYETFDDNVLDTSVWTVMTRDCDSGTATVAETGGRLAVTIKQGACYTSIMTRDRYEMAGGAVTVDADMGTLGYMMVGISNTLVDVATGNGPSLWDEPNWYAMWKEVDPDDTTQIRYIVHHKIDGVSSDPNLVMVYTDRATAKDSTMQIYVENGQVNFVTSDLGTIYAEAYALPSTECHAILWACAGHAGLTGTGYFDTFHLDGGM